MDCHVEFTDAEREIIKERELGGRLVTETGIATESAFSGVGSRMFSWVLGGIGVLLTIGGFIGCAAMSLSNQSTSTPTLYLVIGIPCLVAAVYLRIKGEDKSFNAEIKGDAVDVNDILKNGGFVVKASALDILKMRQAEIEDDFRNLKVMLQSNEAPIDSKSIEF